jgi:serine/threonine-protein kinase
MNGQKRLNSADMDMPSTVMETTDDEELVDRLGRLLSDEDRDSTPLPSGLAERVERARTCLKRLERYWEAGGAAPEPALLLGRFRLVRTLGRGGMGVVYLADDPLLGRQVALKVPRPEAILSPQLRRRFLREAQAAARLSHPHIVPVFDTGEAGAVCFIVSAYCPGGTLAQWLKSQTAPVPIRTAAGLIAVLAEAVHHAHSNGILHRDLKPSNVLLEVASGQWPVASKEKEDKPTSSAAGHWPLSTIRKITDFGLAREIGSSDSPTATGDVIGTPSYMAPEQAEGRLDRLGPPTDIHALGAIFYELLTGRQAFRGRSSLEVVEQVRSHEPTPPRRLRKDVPRDLEAICLKCLEKDPSRRYGSAQELADELGRWLRGEPTRTRPLSWPARLGRKARRYPLATAAAVFALIAALAAPAVIYQTNPLRAAEAIERQLAAGQSVELIPETGMPRFHRIRWAENQTKVGLAPDGTFEVNTWGNCLIELVRDPQVSRYQIRAEVRHERGDLVSLVGLFFGLEELATPGCTTLALGQFSFNDVTSVPEELRRGIPADAPHLPKLTGNPLCLSPYLLGTLPDGSPREQAVNGVTRQNAFQAIGPRAYKWRSLAIEVSDQTVTGVWEDGSPALLRTERDWNRDLRMGVDAITPIPGTNQPRLAVRGGIGLFLIQSKASFRRVVLDPLGD